MVQAAQETAHFPVEWPNPEDAQFTWVFDSGHSPYPLTPLSIDFADRVFRGSGMRLLFAYLFSLKASDVRRNFFPNGFIYSLRFPPSPSDPSVEERQRHAAELAPLAGSIWEKAYLPHISAICRQLQKDNYQAMSLVELATHLETCVDQSAQAFGLTQLAAIPMFQCDRH